VTGFSEEDQANLWQNVTDAQSKAKRGVGQGSVLGAVAGARWAGQRTKIGDSDDEEGPKEGEGAPEVKLIPSSSSLLTFESIWHVDGHRRGGGGRGG